MLGVAGKAVVLRLGWRTICGERCRPCGDGLRWSPIWW